MPITLLILSFCPANYSILNSSEAKYTDTSLLKLADKPSWADEFEKDGKPETTNWDYDLGGKGWGNNELQYYTDRSENARIKDGYLIIEARKEDYLGSKYTSARLVSKNKKDMLYGKIEVRAKLPKGTGTWPAIWMLATDNYYGNNYWPDNGELDIMEHVGFDQNRIHSNIHTKAFNHAIGTNKGNNMLIENASSDFHIYAMDWRPDKITFSIDGDELFVFEKQSDYGWREWPFDKNFHLILNIAIGGNWGGQKGVDDAIFPQKMLIDYVRYYELKN